MNLTRDMYEYLTNFADDRTILNMLSVNKKFNDEEFFERVMRRKYPLLIPFRKEHEDGYESWKSLFVRMVYYISKLKEEFSFPYIPSRSFDPDNFYHKYILNTLYKEDIIKNIMSRGLLHSAEAGRIDLIDYFIKKGGKGGKGGKDIDLALQIAAEENQLAAVKHLIDLGAKKIDWATTAAARGGHLEMVKYLFDKDPENMINTDAISDAADFHHPEVIQYFLDRGAKPEKDEDWDDLLENMKHKPEIYNLLIKF